MNTFVSTRALGACTLAVALFTAPFAIAAGSHDGGHDHAPASIGQPGTNPTRTIALTMGDNYYEPEEISVGHRSSPP